MKLRIVLTTSTDIAGTQEIVYNESQTDVNDFFKKLEAYMRNYIVTFQKNNNNSLKSIIVISETEDILYSATF